jgi:hypothetical protein
MGATTTATDMSGYLGQHINKICPNGYTNDDDNHCAHFVAHVLKYAFGTTCLTMSKGQGAGATIRVHELFPQCGTVGKWKARPTATDPCLVFITNAGNVNLKEKTMVNHPRKHVGIYVEGVIYHYSNRKEKVVRQTPDEFSSHYAAPNNAMFYGTLP